MIAARIAAACGILTILLVAAAPAQVNAVEPMAQSAQAAGRGGADAAIGDSALSQIRNPANLSALDARQVDGLLTSLFPHARYRNEVDGETSHIPVVLLPSLGVSTPLGDGFTLGIASYVKAGLASRYRSPWAGIPNEVQNRTDYKNAALELNLARDLGDGFSVAAGVRGELASLDTKVTLDGAVLDWRRATGHGVGFQGGIRWQPNEEFGIGLGYRSATWTDPLEGPAKLVVPGAIELRGRLETSRERLPQAVTLGAFWRPHERWRLSVDLRWVGYGGTIYDEARLRGLLNAELRSGYLDGRILGLGAEYEFRDRWIAAVGFNYNSQPVDDSNLTPVFSVILETHATAGLQYHGETWQLAGAYALSFPHTERGDGSSEVAPDYDNLVFEQTVHTLSLGAGLRF